MEGVDAELALRVQDVRKFVNSTYKVRFEFQRMTPRVLKAAEAMNKFAEAHQKEIPHGERG